MSPFPPNPHSTFCFFECDFFQIPHTYKWDPYSICLSLSGLFHDMNNDKCHCDKCWWFCLLRIYFRFLRITCDVPSWNEHFLCAVAGGTRDGGVQWWTGANLNLSEIGFLNEGIKMMREGLPWWSVVGLFHSNAGNDLWFAKLRCHMPGCMAEALVLLCLECLTNMSSCCFPFW